MRIMKQDNFYTERGLNIMKIVLLESLGISQELLDSYVKPLREQGHEFAAYERNDDPAVQIEEAKDADILRNTSTLPLRASTTSIWKRLRPKASKSATLRAIRQSPSPN